MTLLRKLALAAPLWALVGTAASAEPGRLMESFLAEGWTFRGAAETETPTTETYGTVAAAGDGVVVQMQGLTLSLTSSLGIPAKLSATSPVISIGTGTPGTPVIVLRDAVITHDLTGLTAGDCGLLDALDAFTAGEISIQFPDGTGFGLDRMMAEGVYWTGDNSEDCRLSGKGTVLSASFGAQGVGSLTLSKSDIALDLPLTVAAAKASRAPSRVSLGVDNLIASRNDGATVQTGRLLTFSADLDGQTLSPLLTLLSARPFFAPAWNDSAAFMDVWNVATLLRADVSLGAESLQTMPPALIPPEITSNFASVGLSTLTWGLQTGLRMRSGDLSARAKSMIVGTGLIDLTVAARTALYSRDQLRAVDAAQGTIPTPSFRITEVDGSWRDFGFDQIFKGIVGLSPQSHFERLAIAARDSGDAGSYDAYSTAAMFFREAARGFVMAFSLDESSGIDLRDVGPSLAADPSWIFSKMTVSAADPAMKKTSP